MAKVELLVTLVAAPGKAEELKKQGVAMLAPTHAEPGNEFYHFYSSDKEGHFFFHELWKSQEALDCHMKTPHFENFEKAIKGLLEGELGINKVTALG